ncbi:MAG: ABC transporter permease, partial [Rhodospirillales bacterium]|nr:ABC transporter permease [Rhodospirillales bacterium]
MSYISLGYLDLALAALLLLLHGALSLFLRLHLGKRLIIAAIRMVVQLLMIGLVLKALFDLASPLWTGLAALLMILFAGREIAARQTHRFTGWGNQGIATISMLLAGTVVTVLALTTQLRPDPWYDPRYALPILGMVLGNTMNGVSLGLDRLLSSASRERAAIEAQLALGRDRRQAFLPLVREACRAGLMPIINSMSAMGIVFLPGMMT